LSEPDQALCAWAEKVTLKISEAGPADVDALRAADLSDNAISDAARVIAFFNYINRIAESLGVDLEPEMPPRD
jgi:alkylhydroperoxidase family enzyme